MTTGGPHIIIIGAGIGGLSFAIALKRQLGYNNFTIYESRAELGGTWNANKYPGCACDVASHFYCLSTDPNPNWTSTHPFQPEILAYWQKLADKYLLRPHIRFNCKVLSTRWDPVEHQYDILAEDLATHSRISTTAHIIISAIGILDVPRLPDIPGIENFKGQLFHSADWPDNVDLRGKRVAVVGSGASAIQFVPIIAKEVDIKWLLSNIPFCARCIDGIAISGRI
ncbi:hypothetical protein BD779DRAFT_190760 [Infundibulicybe gibba]|nr:hypothetical protein BD779DRAFT_190760 [Infundibulicybe gibba]